MSDVSDSKVVKKTVQYVVDIVPSVFKWNSLLQGFDSNDEVREVLWKPIFFFREKVYQPKLLNTVKKLSVTLKCF